MDKEIKKLPIKDDIQIIEDTPGEFFDSISFRIKSPEGSFTIFFDEDRKTKRLVRISAFAGKTGSQQAAWLDAFCRIMSRQLERGFLSLEDIETELSSIRTDKSLMNVNGLECTSGPEAIFIAIQKYKNEKFSELRKQLGYS
jgi:hypothetical protein